MTKTKKRARKKPKIKRRSAEKKIKNEFLISKNMTFSEILNNYPELAVSLMERGMQCIGCTMSAGETLEQGAIMHGINPDKLVKELNKKIEKNEI